MEDAASFDRGCEFERRLFAVERCLAALAAPGASSSASSTAAPPPSPLSAPQAAEVGTRVMLHGLRTMCLNGSLGTIATVGGDRVGVFLDDHAGGPKSIKFEKF